MKNIFRFLMSAAILFGAVSCAKEDISSSLAGGEVEVTLSVDVPELGTRAFGDGLTVNQLFIAVYEKINGITSTVALPISRIDGEGFQGSVAFSGGRATVTMVLLKDKTYDLVFWAQNAKANAEANPEKNAYTVNLANGRTIVANYKAKCNLEDRDAFFLIRNDWTAGAQDAETEFHLYRPFAQINVANSDDDVKFVTANGAKIETSAMTVKTQVANVLDMKTGDVTGSVDVAFAENAIPTEAFHIAGYNYLAMNYLLVKDKELVNLEFVFTDDEGVAYTREYGNVPVQRNYRTNILGQIISSPIDFTVVIEKIFNNVEHEVDANAVSVGDNYYSNLAQAFEEVQNGDVVTLNSDITIDMALTRSIANITIDKDVTLDLNGHNLTANIPDVTSNHSIFYVKKGGKLTFTGEGNVDLTTHNATNNLAALVSNEGGEVVIYSGNYTLTEAEGTYALIPCFVDNNTTLASATLSIYGGTFSFHRNLFRNFANNKNAVATINIYGGTFKNEVDENAYIWNQKPSSSIPEGAGVVNVYGGTFENVQIYDDWKDGIVEHPIVNGCTPVSTADELVAALEAGKSVYFLKDIKIDPATMSNAYGKTGINVKNGQTIEGGGHTLNIKGAGGTWDSGINTTGGIIRNITVTGSFRGVFINHNSDHSEKVVLENVTLKDVVYTISCDQGLYQTIEATNCSFYGWTSFAKTAGEAKFVNCYFGQGNGYKYCRPYSKTEFVGCTFCPGYTVDQSQATVTFTDCTWEE